MRIIRPWHSWIARPPPKGQVTGSTPVGRTIFPRFNLNYLHLSLSKLPSCGSHWLLI